MAFATRSAEAVAASLTSPANGGSSFSWLMTFRSPSEIWQTEHTFLFCEMELYILAILTYLHARRHGGRYYWLWWTTILHGLMTELVSYWYEDVDNFWHAQSTFMWFGLREPLHIIFLYPGYIYPVCVAVSKLNIQEWARPFASGLGEVLIDIPYDIMGIKLLWWTWHDTDTNIIDRTYMVPWTSYFFHTCFGFTFVFLQQHLHRYVTGLSGYFSDDEIDVMPYSQKILAQNWKGELTVAVLTGAFTFPVAVVTQFTPLYHIPHDILGVHTEVCYWMLAFAYCTAVLWGIMRATPTHAVGEGQKEVLRGRKKRGQGTWHIDECWLAIMFHYTFYIVIVLTSTPEDIRATGLHQPIAARGCHSPLVLKEQVGLIGLPNTSYDLTRTKKWDPLTKLTTQVELRYGPYEWIGPPVVITRNHTLCPLNYTEHTQEFWCVKESKCRTQHIGWTPERTAKENEETCTLPLPGTEFYTMCGTPYVDPMTGRETFNEYAMVICGVCVVAMVLFTSIYHYPLTLWHVVRSGFTQVPMYYKVQGQQNTHVLKAIIGRKVDGETGQEMYHVSHGNQESSEPEARKGKVEETGETGETGKASTEWVAKNTLVSDGMGPVYGERGGLYGFFGVHHETSTRERLRTFDSYTHAMERLQRVGRLKQRTVYGSGSDDGGSNVVGNGGSTSTGKKKRSATRSKSKTRTTRTTRATRSSSRR